MIPCWRDFLGKKEEAFEVEGTVTQALANTRFRVQLETEIDAVDQEGRRRVILEVGCVGTNLVHTLSASRVG